MAGGPLEKGGPGQVPPVPPLNPGLAIYYGREYRGAPLFRGADADGPNCKDIINGIAFSMPSCLCLRHCNFPSSFIIINIKCFQSINPNIRNEQAN